MGSGAEVGVEEDDDEEEDDDIDDDENDDDDGNKMVPHVFCTADRAYFQLLQAMPPLTPV